MNHTRQAWTLALIIACAPAVGQAQPTPSNGQAPDPLPEDGRVLLACVVNDSGDGVKNCVVESETPEGFGFGAAALTITGHFKLKPGSASALPGSPIKIPVKFPKENRTATTGSPPPARPSTPAH
jgi:hypothetical protein